VREWEIALGFVRDWLLALDHKSFLQTRAALQKLADRGPALGRPLVDTISGSRVKNLKELRPGSSGRTKLRILFAFDDRRTAVMLVAGDKSGQWAKWYRDAIPVAETLFTQHQASLGKDT
jgi:hypothetical protein